LCRSRHDAFPLPYLLLQKWQGINKWPTWRL